MNKCFRNRSVFSFASMNITDTKLYIPYQQFIKDKKQLPEVKV